MTDEPTLRAAAMAAIDRFCATQGFPVPPLDETQQGRVVRFVGKAPDGREFAIGYELPPPPPKASYEPGDVRPDGSIELAPGSFCGPLGAGTVWVTSEQADAAEFYGWRRNRFVDAESGLVQVER